MTQQHVSLYLWEGFLGSGQLTQEQPPLSGHLSLKIESAGRVLTKSSSQAAPGPGSGSGLSSPASPEREMSQPAAQEGILNVDFKSPLNIFIFLFKYTNSNEVLNSIRAHNLFVAIL